jgi:hypothetical protein
MMASKLDAFTILRNGVKLGYPFVESIAAVLPYVDIFWVEEGYSDDDTFHMLSRMAYLYPQIRLSRHHWQQMQTGFAIGEATNSLLERINADRVAPWLLYVQADELWHPRSLEYISGLVHDSAWDEAGWDAINVPFLHIAENYQKLQFAPGQESYRRAVRVVRNQDYIRSHRDAWTFEGCRRVFNADPTLCEVVHANSTGFENWYTKADSHARELYPDLGHYAMTAAQRKTAVESGVIPEQWLATTSPFADRLPECVLPLVGQLRYEPNPKLLEARRDK